MGHYVYITRKKDVLEDSDEQIAHEEWVRFVTSDPDLTRDPNNKEHCYLFKRPQRDWPLWWRAGEVSAKNPPDDVLLKMARIAAAIGATVQGEAGEVYDPDGREILL